jgi:uncharacterized phage-like protein YoqJ
MEVMMKRLMTMLIALVCFVLFATTAYTQAPTITWPEWGPEHQVDVPPNTPILTYEEGDRWAPNANEPTIGRDGDLKDFFYQEDDEYVYFKLVMHPEADVRQMRLNSDMYNTNTGWVHIYLSVDPQPALDWHDTTGLTYGWYQSGYDYYFTLFPIDSTFMSQTGYQATLREHLHNTNAFAFEQWQGDTGLGVIVEWNENYNEVQAALEKRALQNPQNLEDFELQVFSAAMVNVDYTAVGYARTNARYAQTTSYRGYLLEWTEAVVIEEPIEPITITWPEWGPEHQVDVPPNTPILTYEEGDRWAPNANEPTIGRDGDLKDFFYQEDDEYVYFKLVMHPEADVRQMRLNSDMYNTNTGWVHIYLSVDPQPALDWHDTTGMTYGWYQSGYDYYFTLFPIDSTFMSQTGYQATLREHLHNTNAFAYEQWQGDTGLGVIVEWNENYNEAQAALEKRALQNPQNLEDLELQVFFAAMVNVDYTAVGYARTNARYAQTTSYRGYLLEWTEVAVNVDDAYPSLPENFELSQNYPNPFNPQTTIDFTVPGTSHIFLEVYDILGRKVATLVDDIKMIGKYSVTFDASNLPSGIYFYSLRGDNFQNTKRMVLLK